MKSYKVLSIDGGGIYGVLTVQILVRLNLLFPEFLNKVELFAGTSIGGIIALGLANGTSPEEIKNIFLEYADDIFYHDISRKALSAIGLKSKYNNKNLKKVLQYEFGNKKLNELDKKVLISSYDLDSMSLGWRTWKPKFFHNYEGDDQDCDLIVDIGLATAAAPVFFPTHEGYIDGSLAANNPSMAAICQTQDERAKIDPRPTISDIKLLSIGKEIKNTYVGGNRLDWGYLRWLTPLIEIVKELGDEVVDYQCSKILGNNYCRIFPLLEKRDGLDNYRIMNELIDLADKLDISKAASWIEKNFS